MLAYGVVGPPPYESVVSLWSTRALAESAMVEMCGGELTDEWAVVITNIRGPIDAPYRSLNHIGAHRVGQVCVVAEVRTVIDGAESGVWIRLAPFDYDPFVAVAALEPSARRDLLAEMCATFCEGCGRQDKTCQCWNDQ